MLTARVAQPPARWSVSRRSGSVPHPGRPPPRRCAARPRDVPDGCGAPSDRRTAPCRPTDPIAGCERLGGTSRRGGRRIRARMTVAATRRAFPWRGRPAASRRREWSVLAGAARARLFRRFRRSRRRSPRRRNRCGTDRVKRVLRHCSPWSPTRSRTHWWPTPSTRRRSRSTRSAAPAVMCRTGPAGCGAAPWRARQRRRHGFRTRRRQRPPMAIGAGLQKRWLGVSGVRVASRVAGYVALICESTASGWGGAGETSGC